MIDKSKLYRGQNIQITDQIILRQPTLGEIFDFGESEYLGFVHTITATHMDADMIVFLTKLGVDFNSISDWQLFLMLYQGLNIGSELLFENLDFTKFEIKNKDDQFILQNHNGSIIDETIYKIIVMYIRAMNNISTPQFTKVRDDPVQKQMAIDDAQRQVDSWNRKAKLGIKDSSPLLPYISYLVNKPGFKHDEVTVFNLKVYPFWDSVKRLLAIDNAEHLYHGLYSGCLDLNKNPSLKKEMDTTREL